MSCGMSYPPTSTLGGGEEDPASTRELKAPRWFRQAVSIFYLHEAPFSDLPVTGGEQSATAGEFSDTVRNETASDGCPPADRDLTSLQRFSSSSRTEDVKGRPILPACRSPPGHSPSNLPSTSSPASPKHSRPCRSVRRRRHTAGQCRALHVTAAISAHETAGPQAPTSCSWHETGQSLRPSEAVPLLLRSGSAGTSVVQSARLPRRGCRWGVQTSAA